MLLPLSVKLGKIQLFFQLANNFHTFFLYFLKKIFRPFFSVLYQTMPQRTNQNIRTNEIRYINGLKR